MNPSRLGCSVPGVATNDPDLFQGHAGVCQAQSGAPPVERLSDWRLGPFVAPIQSMISTHLWAPPIMSPVTD